MINTAYAEDELGNPTTDELGTPTTIDAKLLPEMIDFGDVIVNNSSRYEVVKVLNIAKLNMYVKDITLADSDNFALKYTSCNKNQVTPNRYCYFKVIFTPKSAETLATTISIPLYEFSYSTTPALTKTVSFTGNGIAAIPNIELESATVDLGETQVDSGSDYVPARVRNTGNTPLELGQITLSNDSDITVRYDFCSNKNISPSSYCTILLELTPKTAGDKAETLTIPSNDPDSPTVDIALVGKALSWCEGDDFQREEYIWPQPLNFGTDIIGSTHKVQTSVYGWARGCDGLEVTNISVIGDDSGEFSIDNQNCYHGGWENYSYSSCYFKTIFTPTAVGEKTVELQVSFSDGSTRTADITAKSVETGNPELTVEPISHDFGEATVGVYNYNSNQQFVIENIGDVNVNFNSIFAEGNSDDFTGYNWSWCTYLDSLAPGESCDFYSYFIPQELGDRQATVTVDTNAAPISIELSGIGTAPADCSEENITIESIASDNWAERTDISTSDNVENWYWNIYGTPTNTWKRLKNLNPDEEVTPNLPRSDDVVRIKAGHTVSGIPYANIRALCIDKNATLESATSQNHYPYLNINATDYIENKGTIQGLNGADEDGTTTCNNDYWWQNVGTTGCAQPGASVYLNAATVHNEGSIYSGNGGDGKNYAANGGWLSIYGTTITNTDDIGTIDAGRGGSLTGVDIGRAGWGGGISIWGHNSLTSDGRGIHAGNGGNCNADAIEAQRGGDGGNMRLNAANNVNLLAGSFNTGTGGQNCEPLGENGRDGGFNTDPQVLNISGANVSITGGDVTIYGGDGWQLNLSNMEDTIKATGDITIAVGKDGTIDLTGTTGKALQASGTVYIFADNVKLDDDKTLADIIDATNIVVGPAKILRDVDLTVPGKLSGEPGDVLPITVTIANGSAEADTFTVDIVDSEGWTIESVTGLNAEGSITVDALQYTEITFNVVLGADVDTANIITIVAFSKGDTKVSAEANVQLFVVAAEDLLEIVNNSVVSNGTNGSNISLPAGSSGCPTTGVINSVCSNNGHVITDATITGSISGGELSGNITITGMVSKVTIAKGAVITGGKLTGYIINNGQINDFDFVGTLLENGIVGGIITSSNSIQSVFKNVTLAANAKIENITLEGTIIGDPDAPALLQNVTIKAGTYLENVIIGAGVILGDNVTLSNGVNVSDNILTAITKLVKHLGIVIQNPTTNQLELEDDGVFYMVKIISSNHTEQNARINMTATQTLHFITDTNLDIITKPIVQDLVGLQAALATIELPDVEVQTNGNIKVSASDAVWYSARPDIFSLEVTDDMEFGLSVTTVANFVFERDGKKRKQSFYAAPDDMEALLAVVSSVSLNAQKLGFKFEGTTYSGRLDFEVTQGAVPEGGELKIIAEDDDFVIVYPNGARQKLFSN